MTPKKQQRGQMEQPNEEGKDKPEEEVLDFDKPDFVFQPNQHHEWRQQGPFLVCKSCEIEHAAGIGMDKLLVGLHSDGTPILQNR